MLWTSRVAVGLRSQSQAGISLYLLLVHVFIFLPKFSLLHSFKWLALLTWKENVAVAWSYLSFSFTVLVP